jgi:hypothetical protein
MRKILLGGVVVAGITLAGCAQVGDALSSVLGIFKVAFSLDDQQPLSYGIEYPAAFTSNANAIKQYLPRAIAAREAGTNFDLLSSLLSSSGLSLNSLLSGTKLKLGFNVKADNSGNKHRAAFPFSSSLGLFVKNVNSATPTTTGDLPAFDVPASGITNLQIPLTIPFTILQSANVTDDVIAGNSIPYKINGNFKFALVPTTGDTVAKDSTNMNLVTSAISTRPTGTDASLFDTFTALLSYLK